MEIFSVGSATIREGGEEIRKYKRALLIVDLVNFTVCTVPSIKRGLLLGIHRLYCIMCGM